MFWKFAPSSNIDSLLDKEDLTLRELLNEEEVLQECKGQNTKLIEFLCKKEHIEDLVDMITLEPPEDENEAVKYKFPSLACELLTSDVSQINDALGDSEVVRKKLFSFLDREPPVNSLLASFFSKVIGILLSRKPEPTLEYIKSQDDFLASVLKHLGTSAIMDLLLRMVTCVEAADLRAQVLSWLNENQLVQRLIALIDPAFDEELHCNSAQSLCDIIRLSREHMYTMQESAQEDPLLNTLEREETVSLLLGHMFDGELIESVIVNGISILLALLEIRRPAPFGFPEAVPELTQLDVERLARGVSRTLHAVSGRLGDFHKLLINPPKKEVMKCTFGDLDPPLGNTRLHVGKLLSAILMTNTHNINSQLADLKIFDALLDLFFKYEYNNFLHTQVAGCVQTVLTNAANVPTTPPLTAKTASPTTNSQEGSQSVDPAKKEEDEEEMESENPRLVAPLLAHLFEECRIMQRIMDAWEDNHRHEEEDGGHRKGNMGHLTAITNYIVEGLEKGTNCERLTRFVSEMPEEDQGRWQKFLAETLSDMNEKNCRELGGHNPMHFSSDEENDDFRDVPFNTDSSLQQFGFTDEDFAEPDDNIKFDKIETIDFDIKGDTNMPSAQLFEAVCKARVAHLDDDFDVGEDEGSGKSDDDIWQERQISFADEVQGSPGSKTISTTPTVTVRHRSDSGSSTGSSGSSGSPVGSPTTKIPIKIPDAEEMDTSQPPGWKATFEEDSFGNSSSSSNESTPTSSPRAVTSTEVKVLKSDLDHPMDVGQETKGEAVSSSANNDDNWADFDKFNSNTVEIAPSSTSGDQATSSQEQISSFPTADSTSKEVTLEDLDAGSPMAVTYHHSPGEPQEVASSESVPASSSSEESAEQKPAVQDIVMDDVSPTEVQPTQTEVHTSTTSTTEQTKSQDDSTPSSSSSSVPVHDVESTGHSVAMDTDPSSTDESEVKRQRIETQEQQEAGSLGAGGDLRADSVPASTDGAAESLSQSAEVKSSTESEGEDTEITSTQNPVTPLESHKQEQSIEANTIDTANVNEAVAGSPRNNEQETGMANATPDATNDPVSSSHDETVSQGPDSSSGSLKQGGLGCVQHNEVSSSSSVDAKIAKPEEGPDTPMENLQSEITMNGPA